MLHPPSWVSDCCGTRDRQSLCNRTPDDAICGIPTPIRVRQRTHPGAGSGARLQDRAALHLNANRTEYLAMYDLVDKAVLDSDAYGRIAGKAGRTAASRCGSI